MRSANENSVIQLSAVLLITEEILERIISFIDGNFFEGCFGLEQISVAGPNVRQLCCVGSVSTASVLVDIGLSYLVGELGALG